MATQAIQFDAIPDAPVFDAIPDEPEFDAIPDEIDPDVIAREAPRIAGQALTAIDVMRAPFQLDWSEVNEQLDAQRFQESETALARAAIAEEQGSGTGPGSEAFNWRREAEFQRGRISPDTEVGRRLARGGEVQLQDIREEGTTTAGLAVRTPSEMLGSLMGSGLASTAMPTVDAAGRHIGPAVGGALGGALAAAGTVGTGGAVPLVIGLGTAFLGSQAGGVAQEEILQTTETGEETQQRHQRDVQAAAENPGANLLGGMIATSPFFGPSLAQFGRAAVGDRGALMNIGLGGAIGAGMEMTVAASRGETAKAKDIAAAFFSNAVMNEPTKLGRRLGFRPSSEQQAIEDAQAKYGQIGDERQSIDLDVGLGTRGTTSTADVFADVPRRTTPEVSLIPTGEPNAQQISETGTPDGGVRPLEVASTDALVPTTEGGEGFQPSGQGEPLAQGASEAPREIENVTSIRNAQVDAERAQRGLPPMDEVVPIGNREMMQRAADIEANDPRAAARLVDSLVEKPRAVEPEEIFLLLRERTRLKSEWSEAGKRLIEAKAAGDESAVAAAKADVDAVNASLVKVEQAAGRGGAGTQQGRALQARQAFANEDFSLVQMQTDLSIEQGGAPLSEKQKADVAQQADTIAKTQEGMDRILAEREVAKAEAVEDAKVDPKVKSLADRIVARLDLTAKNAATSLRSRLNNLGSAPDPLIVLDVAKIAAAKTAKGAIEFAQWSAEMIKEFGEKVRPFLQAGWDQREQHIDTEVGTAVGGKRKERSTVDKEATAVKARLTALANRTSKLKERTAAGDFSPMRKSALDLSKNPEWVKLKAENDTAKAAYEKSRYEARKAQRTTEQKVRDTVADVFSSSRSILASADISAVGRQGIFFTLTDLFTNPVRLGRQLKRMLQSQFSESKFKENEARIKSRDNADLYESSDLYLADIDHKPSAREEQFKSEIAEKIPVLGKRIVRGSSRGFASMMNEVRADAMDAFVKWSGGKENLDPATAKYLAAAINDLSGRGNVSSRRAQGALEWLANYLFSPRLWVSRFNTAILKPIWRDPLNRAISPRARAVVATQYVKFAGALLALKWLAGLNGGKMEEDPRDSDFGKLQFGSKRYDVMGGIGNMTTLLSRIATQKTKDDKGKLVRIAWQGEKRPERELGQILFNHLRNKGAPIPGAVYDYIYGRHPDRSKVTSTSVLKQTTVPITVSDTLEYFKKDNPASALRDTLINALGVSVEDYRK